MTCMYVYVYFKPIHFFHNTEVSAQVHMYIYTNFHATYSTGIEEK